jgi:hypothetical protein
VRAAAALYADARERTLHTSKYPVDIEKILTRALMPPSGKTLSVDPRTPASALRLTKQ